VRALNQPESWWGWHGYNHPEAMSITQILRADTMPVRVAAILSLAMERGAPMILAADPPGAGKTTILTALLAFAPPDASVYFTRGWGETFKLPPREPDDPPTYILVNEISDHLPVYSRGPYVQRERTGGRGLLADVYDALRDRGRRDRAAHGEVRRARRRTSVTSRLVVPMYVGMNAGRRVRRVSEVVVLEPLGGAYDRHSIARWDAASDTYEVLSTPAQVNALARRFGMEDEDLIQALGKREQLIDALLRDGVMAIDDVQARVFAAAGYETVEE
jgi:hypothetical protein